MSIPSYYEPEDIETAKSYDAEKSQYELDQGRPMLAFAANHPIEKLDLNKTGEFGSTPLLELVQAIQINPEAMIELNLLLSKKEEGKLNLDFENDDKLAAIAFCKNVEVLKILLDAGAAAPNTASLFHMIAAAELSELPEILNVLKELHSRFGDDLFKNAVEEETGDIETGDIETGDNIAHPAGIQCCVELFQFLKSTGVDLLFKNKTNDTIITRVTENMIDNHEKEDEEVWESEKAMNYIFENCESAKDVIDSRKDENSQTPLMIAASRGNAKLVEILLKNGADKSLKIVDEDLDALTFAQQAAAANAEEDDEEEEVDEEDAAVAKKLQARYEKIIEMLK